MVGLLVSNETQYDYLIYLFTRRTTVRLYFHT